MKVLAIGDVVSSSGCEHLRRVLPNLKRDRQIDVVVANGENSAVGNGILPKSAQFLLDSGVDVITTGNHVLRRREIYDYLDAGHPVIRPANYHPEAPGQGFFIIDRGTYQVGVLNLQGQVFQEPVENPFACAKRILDEQCAACKLWFVDFHAEATAEKRALGFYLDGRVAALFGTHTHVQTADEQILAKGTGYITDLGMTGPVQSVIGIVPELAVRRMRTNLPVRFESAEGNCQLQGCLFDIDRDSGRCVGIERIQI
ncbi:MAG: TIGR00282 family metallophosphoesterase [Clostridiales bacterium]|nr:TIGR00282 family metallophosphoesterase [Clostridiales bacterium]